MALSNAMMAGSRSRPQARKKVNDDAAYFGRLLRGDGTGAQQRDAQNHPP